MWFFKENRSCLCVALAGLVLVSAVAVQAAAQETLDIVYTNSDPVFEEGLRSFSAPGNVEINFTWMDQSELRSRLLQTAESKTLPHIIIASSDLIATGLNMQMQQIPAEIHASHLERLSLPPVKNEEGRFALPISKGNHLVMYFNWSLAPALPETWHELLSHKYSIDASVDLVTWPVLEMYWLIPFVTAFGEPPVVNNVTQFDSDGMAEALKFVWGLIDTKVVDINCDYACSLNRFLAGKAVFHINGVWEYEKIKKTMGENVGIRPLPRIADGRMRPYYAETYLFTPKVAVSQAQRATRESYVRYMSSPRFQKILANSMSNFPMSEQGDAHVTLSNDQKMMAESLQHAIPMPHSNDMMLMWEGMLKGFVRFGGGQLEGYQVANYMQHYVDSHNKDE